MVGVIRAAAIIVAAGSGARMGSAAIKKQYAPLMGSPTLAWTIRAFISVKMIEEIVVVVAPGEERYCETSVVPVALSLIDDKTVGGSKPIEVVAGGDDRTASVAKGLESVREYVNVVAVHDGVRPFVAERSIEDSVRVAYDVGAACVAVPTVDTVKKAIDGFIESTPDRKSLWSAQTPQTFRKDVLRRALSSAKSEGAICTDDASLVERMGEPVALVMGSKENIKITEPVDLVFANAIAKLLFGASHM